MYYGRIRGKGRGDAKNFCKKVFPSFWEDFG